MKNQNRYLYRSEEKEILEYFFEYLGPNDLQIKHRLNFIDLVLSLEKYDLV